MGVEKYPPMPGRVERFQVKLLAVQMVCVLDYRREKL